MGFFETVPSCTYNKMVDCTDSPRVCGKCGWCPDVQKQRLQNFALEHPDMAEELACMGLIDKEGT